VAEGLGTLLLLATVVGSGIMAQRLFPQSDGLALLANALATGLMLVVLILCLGPISGAHFNPAVTLMDGLKGGIRWPEVAGYVLVQLATAMAGVVLAHLMFDAPLVTVSTRVRSGSGQLVSEFVATFGLLAVIWSCARLRESAVPFAVGAYITSAYWFTASTSFANPAVTLARTLTDSFAGIRPADAPAFCLMQLLGAGAATALLSWLLPNLGSAAKRVVVPHEGPSRLGESP
jgi:glycerol uptake facilitator-like aquaporin